MNATRPILYSFRRCPYAMRARLALTVSGQACELREVILRDKPREMLEVSPKATVPVLVDVDGRVFEESLDIMLWALQRNDPEAWLAPENGSLPEMRELIARSDEEFKFHLDRYKYPERFPGTDPLRHRTEATLYLQMLNDRLATSDYLFGNRRALADMAIAPFVRQFALTDRPWFDAFPVPRLHVWLAAILDAPIYESMMKKYPPWQPGTPGVLFPAQ